MLPIALRQDGSRAVIVGGGAVALRKAETLLAAGYSLRVVAPEIDVRLRALAEAAGTVIERAYAHGDLDDAALVVAATDDDAVNAAVVADARSARVLVCDAVRPERGDFTMLATHAIDGVTFAVDSGGSTPAFSKRIIAEIAEHFGPEYGAAAKTLRGVRSYAQTTLAPEVRAHVLRAISALPIAELARMNPGDAEHAVDREAARLAADVGVSTTQLSVATRASALAMTQTRSVAAKLALAGIASTIVTVTTAGDRVQDRPLIDVGTNVFVKELELALRDGRAQYAVHSCKDLPSTLDAGFVLAAIGRREDARDAFCSERFASFDELPPGAVVGTSSLRRRLQLQARRADLQYRDIRGNVDTRLRKLRDGDYDAIVLAMAGLNRLNARATYTVPFSPDVMVPAVGQGALAIETLDNDPSLIARLRDALDHRETHLCVAAERAALRRLRAGCNAPAGIHARLVDGRLVLHAVYVKDETPIHASAEAAAESLGAAEALGRAIGDQLLAELGPLFGRFIVLARTQDRPSRIAETLRGRGAIVFELHDAQTGPPSLEAPDAILFPSSAAVRAARVYLDRLHALGQRPRVAAMGPESSSAASAAGFHPDVVAGEASVEAFVESVVEALRT